MSATLTSELDQHAPGLAGAMREFAGASAAKVARIYRGLDFDAFDRVVAEKSRNVLSVRARFRWHDVGSWEGLWEALGGREANVLKGEVIALASEGVLARGSEGRLMVLLGVKDLVAVDTGDAHADRQPQKLAGPPPRGRRTRPPPPRSLPVARRLHFPVP